MTLACYGALEIVGVIIIIIIMDTAIKHPVPYRHWVKPSFVIFDLRAL